MKKLLFVLFAFVLFLSACGGGNDTAGNGEGSGEGVTLRYALWDVVQQPVYEELAAKFTEETGINIEFEVTPWGQYWTNLETAAAGQNLPDVFWMNVPRAQDWIENDVLLPLDDLEFDPSAVPQAFLDAYSRDGSLYALPKDFDTVALYYNETMFAEAGLDTPDETWDWDDFKNAARVITEQLDGVYGFAAPPVWQGGYYEAIFQNDGQPFIENGTRSGFGTEPVIEALEFWHSFHEEGLTPSIEVMAETPKHQLLLGGVVAMSFEGSWMVRTIFEDEFGYENINVAPMPMGPNGTRATTSNSISHVIAGHTEHPEEALAWLEFLNREENNRFVGDAGVAIPLMPGTADGWTESFPSKNLAVHVEAANYAVPLPGARNNMAAIAIETEILNRAWTGEITVREAAGEIENRHNEILAQ